MLAHTITDLLSQGVQVDIDSPNRKVGAGPAEGTTIIIEGIPAHVPLSGDFVSRSPYALRELEGESWLVKDGEFILPVKMQARPKFYNYRTKDQTPYSSIALLHGKDCLASTIRQTCSYWNSAKRCKFCGIELSLSVAQTTPIKTPTQLAEVILKARDLDSVCHAVLTTGATAESGKEIDYLCKCAKAIKAVCDLPIHAQFLPTEDINKYYELKKAGIDTVGIHIESFDFRTLARFAPVKAAIGVDGYERAWNNAVEIFGFNQVSSFILVGLGEDEGSVLKGSEFLSDRGVYPFIVPFRPIPGSLMQDWETPAPEIMKRIYATVAEMLGKKGLSSSKSLAGCVRCGACSAIQAYEMEPKKYFLCRPAMTEKEIASALAIRKDVFVREQGLFEISDLDENDTSSTHIIAKYDDQIIGSVRVFPVKGTQNEWVGGRLAVRTKHRDNHVGALLVKKAMKYVKNRGCTRFTAHIQEQNVRYFSLLGWQAVGPAEMYRGRLHRLMEADLDTV